MTRPAPAWALAVSIAGFFVVTLDALIVSVALPEIGRDVGGGIHGQQWVVDAYTLVFASSMLAAGPLSDRLGARRAYTAGIVVFVVASALCAIAPSIESMIAARLLQGLGAAIMTPASLALLREAYPDSARRARALGLWALGGAAASVAAPAVGGALSLVSWRLIFVVNIPVGLIVLVLLSRVPRSVRRSSPIDWTGQVLSASGLVALVLGIIELGRVGADSPHVVGLLIASVVLMITFGVSQTRREHPLVPPTLVASRQVVACLVAGFTSLGTFYGVIFVMSLHLQDTLGLDAWDAGLAFLPMTLLVGFMNVGAGRAIARVGVRLPAIFGFVLTTLGCLGLAIGHTHADVLGLSLLMIPIGLGGAFATPCITAALLDIVPPELVGTAGGLLNTSRQVGGALAIAVFGGLIGALGTSDALSVSLLASAALVGLTAVLCRALPGRLAA